MAKILLVWYFLYMAEYQQAQGYGKRSIWQWVVIYLVVAAIVYGLIYYFIKANRNSNNNSGINQTPSSGY
jgi:hypothetical protein